MRVIICKVNIYIIKCMQTKLNFFSECREVLQTLLFQANSLATKYAVGPSQKVYNKSKVVFQSKLTESTNLASGFQQWRCSSDLRCAHLQFARSSRRPPRTPPSTRSDIKRCELIHLIMQVLIAQSRPRGQDYVHVCDVSGWIGYRGLYPLIIGYIL